MSYLRDLCLFAYSDAQQILCCGFFFCLCLVNGGIQYCIVLYFSVLFVLILCLVYTMLPVSLDCQFFIAPSVSLTRLTRRVTLVVQELLTLPGHLRSLPVLVGFVLLGFLCVVFCRSLFVLFSLLCWPLCCLSLFDLRCLVAPF